MTFNSLQFFIFFPVVSILYYVIPKKYQWIWLLIASYTFYLLANFKFGFFLLSTTITTYYAAIGIGKISENQKSLLSENKDTYTKEQIKLLKATVKKHKKRVMAVVLLLNFGILAFLKYINFFMRSVEGLFSTFHSSFSSPALKLLLPLGISFYTFQAMGYLIDVYRGKYPPERNLAKLALFLAFFPQIMEGPIGRYNDLAHQLYEPHEFDYKNAKFGLQLMLWGYFKKTVIADRAGVLVNMVYGSYQNFSGTQIAVIAVVYAVQIYADFSGYIDIATGAAQFLGIRLARNFDHPYFSKSVSEFWRRWHITLGTWFKDYLFYPLSLSKGCMKLGKFSRNHFSPSFAKNVPAYFGLAVVWLTTGLWHGSDWHYVLYGVYYGVLIILSMQLKPFFQKTAATLRIPTESFGWKLFQVARTFCLVCIGFILFRAENLGIAFSMLQSIFTLKNPHLYSSFISNDFTRTDIGILLLSTLILAIVSLLQRKQSLRESLSKQNLVLRWGVYCAAALSVLFLGVLASSDPTQFIYFQF
jgi:alginate O-acetyltransferase complex protein AlgI